MKIGVVVKEFVKPILNLVNGAKWLKDTSVYVGVKDDKTVPGSELTMAQLLALLENGSPINNMPPREVLAPALSQDEVSSKTNGMLRKGAFEALRGNISGAEAEYKNAGELGANAVKEYITSGALAPNAPITVHGGWMRNKVSGKAVYVTGKRKNTPLINTGKLVDSIGYEITKKK